MRLLAALVLLALATLMFIGSVSEAMRARPVPHVPRQIERPREEQPLQRRRVDCESPGHVEMLWGCA